MSLYTDLLAAGVQCSNHQSDLYFPVTDETAAILAKYPKQKAIAQTFRSNIDGILCFDVPFGFDPYWEKKFSEIPCSTSQC